MLRLMEIDFTPRANAGDPYVNIIKDADCAVLFLHGITGSPAAWSPIARAITAKGISVSVPLLPGHGTSWQELNATTFDDWLQVARLELTILCRDHQRVIVAGLSMGGALALALGEGLRKDQERLGEIIVVNPALYVDSPLAPLLPVLHSVIPSVPAIANDIAHPGRDEMAYDRTPIAAVASLAAAQRSLREDLWTIDRPVTALVSGLDNVVGPKSLRALRSGLSDPPRIISLRRSRHVATLDYDAHVIAEVIVESATLTSA